MEWVEVEGKSVEIAIQAGLEELGIESVEEAEVEVLKEPERGFLGFGRSMALVRIKPKPRKKRRRRGGRRRGRGGGDQAPAATGQKGRQRAEAGKKRESAPGGREPRGGSRQAGGQPREKTDKGGGGQPARKGGGRKPRDTQAKGRDMAGGGERRRASQQKGEPAMQEESSPAVDVQGQADIVKEFLSGLLDAFGLEGEVAVRVDEGIVFADITGEQTEALVGSRGVILQSILELCRTVVQRKSHASARIRLDIAGYTERRREALRIYAARLADQVLDDGEEIMLEPMNPADRKVVHDAIAEIDDVRTYSEGEEPNRSVVIGIAPGVVPRGESAQEDRSEDGVDGDADEDEEPVSAETPGPEAGDENSGGPGDGDSGEADVAATEAQEDTRAE